MIKLVTLFIMMVSFNSYAINITGGSFQATQKCPAYVSKNSRSIVNSVMLQLNQYYPLKEINKPQPDWLRIEFPDHKLFWVNAYCGEVHYKAQNSSSCSNAGMADSHLLALSSQPGFCQTYGFEAGRPECVHLSKNSYQAKHLTLHGLWPNLDSCGQRYGFCGVRPRTNHCSYIPLDLSPTVDKNLKMVMPSYNFGSCLERHEWNKHGSCQALSVDEYFSLAIRLTKEVNESLFGQYLTAHTGQSVQLAHLRELLQQSFGTKNAPKIYLSCKNKVLVDIFIQLPALMPINDSLPSLLDNAPTNNSRDLCGGQFTISNFSTEAWY
jgi:ribonuclease T2